MSFSDHAEGAAPMGDEAVGSIAGSIAQTQMKKRKMKKAMMLGGAALGAIAVLASALFFGLRKPGKTLGKIDAKAYMATVSKEIKESEKKFGEVEAEYKKLDLKAIEEMKAATFDPFYTAAKAALSAFEKESEQEKAAQKKAAEEKKEKIEDTLQDVLARQGLQALFADTYVRMSELVKSAAEVRAAHKAEIATEEEAKKVVTDLEKYFEASANAKHQFKVMCEQIKAKVSKVKDGDKVYEKTLKDVNATEEFALEVFGSQQHQLHLLLVEVNKAFSSCKVHVEESEMKEDLKKLEASPKPAMFPEFVFDAMFGAASVPDFKIAKKEEKKGEEKKGEKKGDEKKEEKSDGKTEEKSEKKEAAAKSS